MFMKPILVAALLLASFSSFGFGANPPPPPVIEPSLETCVAMCPGARAVDLTMCAQGLFCTCYCGDAPVGEGETIVGGYITSCATIEAAADVWQNLCPNATAPRASIGPCTPNN